MKAISKPVATSIINSILSISFSVFKSDVCFELSDVSILVIFVYVPASWSPSVLLNITVASILSPGLISVFAKLILLIV